LRRATARPRSPNRIVESRVGCAIASQIVIVTGASGAGKTTVVTRLAEHNLADVTCAFFDAVGVPPPDEMPRLRPGNTSAVRWRGLRTARDGGGGGREGEPQA